MSLRFFVISAIVVLPVLAAAQTAPSIGSLPPLGTTTLDAGRGIGQSTLPVCTVRTSACAAVPYTFIGNGNWDVADNWLGNVIPPATLPAGATIYLQPVEGGECVLNVNQTIAAGALLYIPATKRLRLLKNLTYLK